MKGDFTRDTFDSKKHFSRVLMQQGRITLDADHNEQTAILLHHLRTLARDLIGPHAAPIENQGFVLSLVENDLQISAGRYYVDGILVENDNPCSYSAQPDYPIPEALLPAAPEVFWLYLDVWERHLTPIEDDAIREKALGGPDTCARAKVVWQVRALGLTDQLKLLEDKLAQDETADTADVQAQIELIKGELAFLSGRSEVSDPNICDRLLALLPTVGAKLNARVDPGQKIDDACVMPPDSKYRGPENQLYRVEIHQGGVVGAATFKWSRDNGSVATAWLNSDGNDLQVGNSRGFAAGNWVELSDDTSELQGTPGVLVKLTKVEGGMLSVDPDTMSTPDDLKWSADLRNPKVRRWDQVETDDISLVKGAMPVSEMTTSNDLWVDLEDGVQIQFAAGGEYHTGDYWLIPARVATGKIEWPQEASQMWQPPHGVEHHYAPLGFVEWTGTQLVLRDSCQCTFSPRSSCFNLDSFLGEKDTLKPPKASVHPKATKPKSVSPTKVAKRRKAAR